MPKKLGINTKKLVQIALPKYDNEVTKGDFGEILYHIPATIQQIIEWFKGYNVDTIELWISGFIESGGITKLIVSAKGEGGMKVVLKPKPQ